MRLRQEIYALVLLIAWPNLVEAATGLITCTPNNLTIDTTSPMGRQTHDEKVCVSDPSDFACKPTTRNLANIQTTPTEYTHLSTVNRNASLTETIDRQSGNLLILFRAQCMRLALAI